MATYTFVNIARLHKIQTKATTAQHPTTGTEHATVLVPFIAIHAFWPVDSQYILALQRRPIARCNWSIKCCHPLYLLHYQKKPCLITCSVVSRRMCIPFYRQVLEPGAPAPQTALEKERPRPQTCAFSYKYLGHSCTCCVARHPDKIWFSRGNYQPLGPPYFFRSAKEAHKPRCWHPWITISFK